MNKFKIVRLNVHLFLQLREQQCLSKRNCSLVKLVFAIAGPRHFFHFSRACIHARFTCERDVHLDVYMYMPFIVKGLFVAGNVEFKMSRSKVEVILKAHIVTGTHLN